MRSLQSPNPSSRPSSSTRLRQTAAVVGLAFALGAAACTSDAEDTAVDDTAAGDTTVGDAAADVVATQPAVQADVDGSDPGAGADLSFTPCGAAECATLDVPLDYDDPSGPTVPIHVTRHAATGDRVGVLFLNPGGPGGSLEDMVAGMGQFGPPPLTEAFDLVGVDPRGTGKSGQINCNANWEEDLAQQISIDDGLADDIAAVTADFEASAEQCEADYGIDFLSSITTENAARDIESVRTALGGEPLNYLGYSYGTAIGAVYATLYPDSIRSMILDGAVPTGPSPSDVESRAASVDTTLQRLDLSCRLWEECPIRDVGLLEAAEQVRMTLAEDGSIGMLRPHALQAAINGMVAIPWVMPDLAEGLSQALEGSGGLLNDIGSSFLTPLPDGGFQEFSGAAEAIICADGWDIVATDASELLGQAERTVVYEDAGPNWGLPCNLWPVEGNGIPAADYTGDAPILVVGNTYDAITPLRWSEELADRLGPNASLLTWDGSAHTAVFNGSRCVDDHALAYLMDGVVPEPGTVCALRGLIGLGFSSNPVVVNRVTAGSSSDLAGVEIGDRIVEMDGREIQFDSDVLDGFVGDEVELTVERDGALLELSMVRGVPVWELWRTADVES